VTTVTCHTEGCENVDLPIEVPPLTFHDPDTGEYVAATVVCGVCGNPITDNTA
jgi:hypothetical protein